MNHQDSDARTIERVTLQSLTDHMGEYKAMRHCLPIAFYMMFKANGYLTDEIGPVDFCSELDWDQHTTANCDWSRPAVSDYMRNQYAANVVSWQLNGGADTVAMRKTGYLRSKVEEDFFHKHIFGKTVEAIVRSGFPVLVTVKPNFGGSGTSNLHAVIIDDWQDHGVRVVDSDARNTMQLFASADMMQSISPNGAGTVVLPRV